MSTPDKVYLDTTDYPEIDEALSKVEPGQKVKLTLETTLDEYNNKQAAFSIVGDCTVKVDSKEEDDEEKEGESPSMSLAKSKKKNKAEEETANY